MNVYDFDGTIYNGDSTIAFYKFVLKRHPLILRYLPAFCIMTIKHKMGKCSTKEWKACFFKFLSALSDIENEVSLFWQLHMKHIFQWYHQQKNDTDIIISASPEFLLETACRNLNIGTLIASEVDMHTGKFQGENCKGEEKVRRFRELFPTEKIDKFYSDSVTDLPMAKLAKEAYFVKKGNVLPWDIKKVIDYDNNKTGKN